MNTTYRLPDLYTLDLRDVLALVHEQEHWYHAIARRVAAAPDGTPERETGEQILDFFWQRRLNLALAAEHRALFPGPAGYPGISAMKLPRMNATAGTTAICAQARTRARAG